MCTAVHVKMGGAWSHCYTKGALALSLGFEPKALDGYPHWQDNMCLCPCDIEATAEVADMLIEQEESGDILFKPKGLTAPAQPAKRETT